MTAKEELIQYVVDRSDRTLDETMVENLVYWFLSIIVNKKKRYIKLGNNKINMNYYGLVFARSNSGKSYILNLLLELFNEKDYEHMLMTLFKGRNEPTPHGDVNDTAMKEKFIKAFPPIKKDSTTQAIHKAAESISIAACTNGSFNIYSDEFFANASQPILDMLVEGHDGIYKAPMIKGNKDDMFLEYQDIKNLTTNLLGLSSIAAIMKDQKKLSTFIGEMERAWFKRSYVYFNDQFQPVAKEESDIRTNPLSDELKHLLSIEKDSVSECIPEITISDEALEVFNHYRKEYINGEIKSEFSGLLDIYKTLKLAGIICASDHRSTISIDDFNEAIEFDKKSFKMSETFCRLEHPHIRAFMELSSKSCYENELVETGILPAAKRAREDTLELVEQLAYTKNMRLVSAGSKVKKLSIDELETTNLSKMIIATSAKESNKPEMEINFKSQEVSFFGEGMTVEALVTSKVQSYCLNHFESTDKAPDGHRKKEYVIPGQNLIAFDIDEGMTVQQAQQILSPYIYIIYTTKSHQKDKNGIICDRFRIIIPTKTIFYVNPEEHKGLYENISSVIGIPNYDVATRNQGRLWFTNPNAEVIVKKDGEPLDVRCCIPETETSNHILPNLENIDSDEKDARIAGMQKYALINGIAGARNDVIFRLAKFVQKEMGEDPTDICHQTNNMLSTPLPESEVNTILRNLRN